VGVHGRGHVKSEEAATARVSQWKKYKITRWSGESMWTMKHYRLLYKMLAYKTSCHHPL